MVSQKLATSVLMELVNALSKSGFLRSVFVDSVHVFFQFGQKTISKIVVHQNIVTADAELTTVQKCHCSRFLGSIVEVTALINNHWALASKFEDAGHEVFSRSCSDKLSFLCASCEDDLIKFARCCSNCDIYSAVNALVAVLVEEPTEESLDGFGRVWCHL